MNDQEKLIFVKKFVGHKVPSANLETFDPLNNGADANTLAKAYGTIHARFGYFKWFLQIRVVLWTLRWVFENWKGRTIEDFSDQLNKDPRTVVARLMFDIAAEKGSAMK